MKILFVDNKSSENYDFSYIQSNSLGGTESTVLKIARELAKEHQVTISQINRTTDHQEQGVRFIHRQQGLAESTAPDKIIILRKYRLLTQYRTAYPNAQLFVWIHNFQKYESLTKRQIILNANAHIICVSKYHKQHTHKILNGWLSWVARLVTLKFKDVPTTTIYNPVDEAFTQSNVAVDPNKLFFFSTINKGLPQVLEHFQKLLQQAPDYTLYIAGATAQQLYSADLDKEMLNSASVVILGKIPKQALIDHLRSAFCVFYPQNIHPETFGLIYIEANCVGTPVLAHPFGAAAEILDDTDQLVDANNTSAVTGKLLSWKKNGRPRVNCQQRFQLPGIIARWKTLLGLHND